MSQYIVVTKDNKVQVLHKSQKQPINTVSRASFDVSATSISLTITDETTTGLMGIVCSMKQQWP